MRQAMNRINMLLASLVLAQAFNACAKNRSTLPAHVLIKDVPHVEQEPDFCGEACVEMYLKELGYDITQHNVFNVSGLDPLKARGCHTVEMVKALKALGFQPGGTWYKVRANSESELQSQWQALHADLLMKVPSIVCMRTSDSRSATEHFRLVLGYDPDNEEVIYHEPAEEEGAYKRMKLSEFLKCWPLKYSKATWTVIRMSLAHEKIKEPSSTEGFTKADFALHMMKLKEKMPEKGFHVVIEPPFVVLGDERAGIVEQRAANTIRWAVKRLKHMYFKKDPEYIIDVWLFKDKASYRKYTKEIFGDNPDTPFGYSSSMHRALIMNIATGGGTLVHEIVHPFVRANFPDCPAWLNEGLGSLYEQSGGKGNDIIGMTNWRLAGLQKAIAHDQVPSFKELTSTTDFEFYNRDKGTNYAQARYLCYYLQEKGLLTTFYHDFHKNRAKDPTGYGTLKKVLKEKDMDDFKERWEKYTMKLRFP